MSIFGDLGKGFLRFFAQKYLNPNNSRISFVPYSTILVSSTLIRAISYNLWNVSEKTDRIPLVNRGICCFKRVKKPLEITAHQVDRLYSKTMGIRTIKALDENKVPTFCLTRGEVLRNVLIKPALKTAFDVLLDLLIIRSLGLLKFNSSTFFSLRDFYCLPKFMSLSLTIAGSFFNNINSECKALQSEKELSAESEKKNLQMNRSNLSKEELMRLLSFFANQGKPLCGLFSFTYPAQWVNFINLSTEVEMKAFIFKHINEVDEEKKKLLNNTSELSPEELILFASYCEYSGGPFFDKNDLLLAKDWEFLMEEKNLVKMQGFLCNQLLAGFRNNLK